MRLALLSDIHGNLAALEAVVADVQKREVDRIVNLGDSLSGPLLPLETARYLMDRNWINLAGNHERQLLTFGPERRGPSDAYTHAQLGDREFDWLRSLHSTCRLSAEVLLCHGTPVDDNEYLLESVEHGNLRMASLGEVARRVHGESYPLVACGHSHVARSMRVTELEAVVNPGSVGLPAYAADDPDPHIVETGSPDARYAIVEQTPFGWTAALITVPYDHRSMAALARARGRSDWERALLTGAVT